MALQPSDKAIQSPPHLLGDTAEEFNQAPVTDDMRLVPLDTDVLNTRTEDEYQVAMNLARTAGTTYGRVVGRGLKWRGPNLYGNAYTKLQAKLAKERELKETLAEGVEVQKLYDVREVPGQAEADIGKPQWQAIDNRTDTPEVLGTFKNEKDATAFLEKHQGRVIEPEPVPAPPPEAAPIEYVGGLVDEMDRNDGYVKWVTFGDEAYDQQIGRVLQNRPEIEDGLISGIRVRSKEGADVPPELATKVPDEGHIYSLIDATGDLVEQKLRRLGVEEQSTIALQQTEQLADILGTSKEKLVRDFAGGEFKLGLAAPGELAGKIVAGKNLLVAEIKKLDELTDLAAREAADRGVTPQTRHEWVQQAEVAGNLMRYYRGVKTDIARALSAMRTPAHADQALVNRDIERLLDDLGGPEQIDAAIDAYRSSPDLVSRANQLRQLTKMERFWDGVHEMWINSMLAGWFSHVKNTTGTAAVIFDDLVMTGVTAARQGARASLGGPAPDVTFGDLGSKLFGYHMSGREMFIAGARAFWLREEMAGVEMTIVSGKNPMRRDAISADGLNASGMWGMLADWSGNLMTLGRAPTRALMAEDAFWKMGAFRGSLYEQAHRQGRADGHAGDDLSQFIADFVHNPPAAAAEKAKDYARYVTLQSNMEGALKNLQKVAGTRGGRMIAPFYKTPTNMILFVAERSPAAYIFKMRRYKDAIAAGGEEAAMANTRMMVGTAIMTYLYFDYEEGMITGGLSSDPGLRKNYERIGMRPYHIKFGDTYYNYAMFEPLSTVLGLVMDAMEIINHPDTDDREATEIWAGVASAVGYNVTQKSFMTGVMMSMDAMRAPERYSERMINNYLRSMYPGSAALNEAKIWLDPMKRMRTDLREQYYSRLPGLSETVPLDRDLWGRPQHHTRFRSPYTPNVVDMELVRLSLDLGKHAESVMQGQIELTSEKVSMLHERAGVIGFDRLKKLMDPKTEQGAMYAKLKKASEDGDRLATDAAKNMFREEMLAARQIAEVLMMGGARLKDKWINLSDPKFKKLLKLVPPKFRKTPARIYQPLRDRFDEIMDETIGEAEAFQSTIEAQQ